MKTENKNGNQPAFPHVDAYLGLTKREYFAGLAMQGLLANSMPQDAGIQPPYAMSIAFLIKSAIEYTDELLKQLDNE